MRKTRHIIGSLLVVTFLFISINSCTKHKRNDSNGILQKPKENIFTCTAYIEDYLNKSGMNYLVIDTVQWFSGDTALKAFNEDKKTNNVNETDISNGYYIRNQKRDSLEFKVSNDATIIMQTFSYDNDGNFNFNEKVKLSDFLKLYTEKEYNRFKQIPFIIQVTNNEITDIQEQYIP